MTESRDEILLQADFDPKWRSYFFLKGILVLTASLIGIPLLPVWMLGLGQWYCRRYFENLRCTLHERSLVVGHGILVKSERTIPLDKIQDLTLIDGPLLDRFGLTRLALETAGQRAAAQGASEADLTGIVGAREFRDRVLAQRDTATRRVSTPEHAETREPNEILIQIRDSLNRIEGLLAEK